MDNSKKRKQTNASRMHIPSSPPATLPAILPLTPITPFTLHEDVVPSSDIVFFSSDALTEADVSRYQEPSSADRHLAKRLRTSPYHQPNLEGRFAEFDRTARLRARAHARLEEDLDSSPPPSGAKGRLVELFERGGFQAMSHEMYYNGRGKGEEPADDYDLECATLLNQVIMTPMDAFLEPGGVVPGPEYYRPLLPNIHLDLRENRIADLHPNLFKVEHITELQLGNNRIKRIRGDFKNLKKLKTLDLRNNLLTALPYDMLEMFACGSLELVELQGNPLPPMAPEGINCTSSGGFGDWKPLYPYAAKSPHYVDNRLWVFASSAPAYLSETGVAIPSSPPVPFTATRKDPNFVAVDDTDLPREEKDIADPTETWFAPLPSQIVKLKSLTTLALETAIRAYFEDWTHPCAQSNACPHRGEYTGDYSTDSRFTLAYETFLNKYFPSGVESKKVKAVFSHAYANVGHHGYSPFRTCHGCAKPYIIPRAVWAELWAVPDKGEKKKPRTSWSAWSAGPGLHSGPNTYPFLREVCSWACVPIERRGLKTFDAEAR